MYCVTRELYSTYIKPVCIIEIAIKIIPTYFVIFEHIYLWKNHPFYNGDLKTLRDINSITAYGD